MPAVAVVVAIPIVTIAIVSIIPIAVAIMEPPWADGEICAATAVNPNAAVPESPRAAVYAGSFALLADDFHSAVSVDAAEVTVEVVRRARNFVIVRVWH